MKTRAGAMAILILFASPTFASQPTADDLLTASNGQLSDKHFYLALDLLGKAERHDPGNLDVKLQIVRVLAWQGRYDEAREKLKILGDAYPDNADIKTVAAYIDFYQGHFDKAADGFQDALETQADNTDALEGLKLAQNAANDAAGFLWQLDTGYERSNFARQPQTPWNMEFIQLARSFDQGATSVHGRYEYYDEFENSDQYYELGVDHRFTPWANAYLYGGHTVDASFHPRWRVEPGGNLRVMEAKDALPGVWLTLDAKEDTYGGNIDIATINPGLRLEYGDWALSPNLVVLKQWGLAPIFGWNARLDGPITDGFRFYVGYANAPETEDAVTVYTASAYGGVAYDLSDAETVNIAYTHDDRQNSWIRHAVDIAFTQRF